MEEISSLPIPKLLKNGYLFLWTINCHLRECFELLDKWNLVFVDTLVWLKTDSSGTPISTDAHYFKRFKEVVLVARTESYPSVKAISQLNNSGDIICEARREISRKPDGIYELVEGLVENGKYCELFAR
jgi:mRNA (2'-O-methyladenosine-N6-)-methyltransferase